MRLSQLDCGDLHGSRNSSKCSDCYGSRHASKARPDLDLSRRQAESQSNLVGSSIDLFGSSFHDSSASGMSLTERPSSAPVKGRHGRGMLSHPGALSWMYAQPEVDVKRTKVWLKSSVSVAERKLRLVVKRPLEKEKPDEFNQGLDCRLRRLDRINRVIAKASKILPTDALVLEAGKKRLDRIRSLPLIPASQEADLQQELEVEADLAKCREDVEADEAANEQLAQRIMLSRRHVPQFAKFCDCGSRFLEDAMCCRKCGGVRREVGPPVPEDDATVRQRLAIEDEMEGQKALDTSSGF